MRGIAREHSRPLCHDARAGSASGGGEQSDPNAIASDLAAAGISMPMVEGAYRIGTRRVIDQADVATWYAIQTAPRMEGGGPGTRSMRSATLPGADARLSPPDPPQGQQGKFIKVRAEVPGLHRICLPRRWSWHARLAHDPRAWDGVRVSSYRHEPRPIRAGR